MELFNFKKKKIIEKRFISLLTSLVTHSSTHTLYVLKTIIAQISHNFSSPNLGIVFLFLLIFSLHWLNIELETHIKLFYICCLPCVASRYHFVYGNVVDWFTSKKMNTWIIEWPNHILIPGFHVFFVSYLSFFRCFKKLGTTWHILILVMFS